jgi:transposase
MLPNYIKSFIGIEDVKIKKIIQGDNSLSIEIETNPQFTSCPQCKLMTNKVHDYRKQVIKHMPIMLKPCFLVLKKRRYICTCGKRFYENYSFLAPYKRRTHLLTDYIAYEVRNPVTLKSIAERANVSSNTVTRIIDYLSFDKPQLKDAIAIDEFKGNANGEKFQCILTDPIKGRLLDILANRKYTFLSEYFKEMDKSMRLRVKFFVCDMWNPYIDIAKVYFPNAKIIIDKYHFIRQVTWAIENVRKRLQKTMTPTIRKYYKRSRRLILTRYKKLKGEDKQACDLMLLYNDDLRLAHRLKEQFFDLCQKEKYSEQRIDFWNWVKYAESSGIPEFEKCAKTYRNWSKYILNAFKYGYTNGVTEGYNNKIKVLKRVSYGVRNFERFRIRILSSCN